MFTRLTDLYRQNREQGHLLIFILTVFLIIYFIPAGTDRFDNAILEAVRLTNWYAQEHVILCLLPAFVIAGAMAVYISQGSVLRYLGPKASKPIALGVASVSGTALFKGQADLPETTGGFGRPTMTTVQQGNLK